MKTHNKLLYLVIGLVVFLNIGLYYFHEELGFELYEIGVFWWLFFQAPISIFQEARNYYLKRKYQDSAAHFVPEKYFESLKQKKIFAGLLLTFLLGAQAIAIHNGDFEFAIISAILFGGFFIYFLNIISPGILAGINIRNIWLYPSKTLFHINAGDLYELDNTQMEDVQIIDEQLVIKYKYGEYSKEFRMNSGYFSKNEFQAVMRAIQRNVE